MCSSLLHLAVGSLTQAEKKKYCCYNFSKNKKLLFSLKMTKETFHCSKQGRTGNKQENPVMEYGLSCNSYRFPFTVKNSDTFMITLLSVQHFPACSLFYHVRHFSARVKTPVIL
jgi:hypothetical protein